MKAITKILFVCALVVAASSSTWAQGPPPPPPNPAAVPIDGGLSLLLAAGAGLGARKMWKQKAPN
jgi:hypothetical protein